MTAYMLTGSVPFYSVSPDTKNCKFPFKSAEGLRREGESVMKSASWCRATLPSQPSV